MPIPFIRVLSSQRGTPDSHCRIAPSRWSHDGIVNKINQMLILSEKIRIKILNSVSITIAKLFFRQRGKWAWNFNSPHGVSSHHGDSGDGLTRAQHMDTAFSFVYCRVSSFHFKGGQVYCHTIAEHAWNKWEHQNSSNYGYQHCQLHMVSHLKRQHMLAWTKCTAALNGYWQHKTTDH